MSKVSSAKTRGRLTKKELKQDKLVQYTYQIEAFYRRNQTWVVAAAVAVVAIVVGITLFRKMSESGKLEKSYQLTLAKMSYGSGHLDEAKQAFEKVVANSGGTSAAEAKYFLGRVEYEQGDYPAAASQFEAYLRDYAGNKQLNVAALSGLAATYEVQGKLDDAIGKNLEIAEKYPDNAYSPQALMEVARLYIKQNQKDKAIDIWKRIVEKYPDSAIIPQVKQKISTYE